MTAAPLRFAILGTGAMAGTMLAALRAAPGVTVAGVGSRTPARAANTAAAWGLARIYADAEEIAADPAIDAVYIATDPAAHAEAALTLLAAGKAVLCEKPCATSPADVRRIADAAAASGALFMEAIATPFLPAVAEALARAGDGTLGAATSLTAEFGYPITPQSNPLCFASDGGGVLLDRAIYLVALARLALGPIAEVQATLVRDAAGIDVHAGLLLRHAGGATAQLAASFTALLGNAATIGCARGGIDLRAPLLACEHLRVTHVEPATARTAAPAGGLKDKLKASPRLRRAAALASLRQERHLPYGASPYAPELDHFCALVRAGATESPVLPPSLSLEIHEALARARGGAPA